MVALLWLVGCVHDAPIERFASWREVPLVLYSSSLVPEAERAVCGAVEYVRRHGHDSRGCVMIGPGMESMVYQDGQPRDGLIAVELVDGLGAGVLAETATYARWDGSIRAAVIAITWPLDDPDMVLAHEMLHSRGYPHLPIRGHILYPSMEGAGDGDEGITWSSP